MRRLSILVAAAMLLPVGAYGQLCPASCTSISSGGQEFCRCRIYRSPNSNDRIQLVTDNPTTIVDVDGDSLRDIPFGIWYYGREGTYILRHTDSVIPGTFTEVQIADTPTYGITSLGDVNGDGLMDFAVTLHSTESLILTSPGSLGPYSISAIFHDPTTYPNSITASSRGIYFSDYSGGISYYDFATSTLIRRLDTSYRYCGDGITYGDFNRDGYIDAACSNHDGSASSPFNGLVVYYFNGITFMTPEVVSTDPFQGILAYDFDHDGNLDILAAGSKVSVFYRDGSAWTEVILDSSFSRYGYGYNRVNIMDLDCDGDVDVVAATSCPPSGGAMLVWYENVDSTSRIWSRHPIDTSGYNCSGSHPYPYGVRVGLLNETDTVGRGDIVVVRNASNEIWAYYNVTPSTPECIILGGDDDLKAGETYGPKPDWEGPVKVYSSDGRLIYSGPSLPASLKRGIYFLKRGDETRRVIVR